MENIKNDFFEIQEKTIKNSLLIRLIQASRYPNQEIVIGQTVQPVDVDITDYLIEKGLHPKTVIYSIVISLDENNVLHVGLKYEDLPTLWKFKYELQYVGIRSTICKICTNFPIHPAKLDKVFEKNSVPQDFLNFLAGFGCINLWRCGFTRKYEKAKDISQVKINWTEIQKYKELLQKSNKKYRLFAKILLKLIKTGNYSLSNSAEKFSFNLSKDSTSITAEYYNYAEEKIIIDTIELIDFMPANIKNIKFPLMRLLIII